jgi:pimeloyl-ACP methyl ester carboxylesterase
MGVTATGIHYDVVGDGEPLLLLAGQANSRRWWDPVRADFAARHRTVALDALGTGASAAPDGAEYSTRRFAADAVAVLDAAGIERAHVYGTSMGGKVAQWLAIDHPGRVGALVLGCTTPGGSRALVAGRDVVGPLAGPTAAARRALAELMVTPEWLERHPDGADAVLGDPTMTQAARRGHRIARARHAASAALHRIDTPALVLHGTEDAFCPAGNADLLVAGIAGAALRVFEGARHAYFLEHRAAASAAVLAHLAAHPVRTTDRAALPD